MKYLFLIGLFSMFAYFPHVFAITLFAAADDQSARYEVQPDQQLVVTHGDNPIFSEASLISSDGQVQLVGYVHKSGTHRSGSQICYSMAGLTSCGPVDHSRFPPFRKDPTFHCSTPGARYVGEDKILGGCWDPSLGRLSL